MPKQVNCTACEFQIRSENEDELVEFVQEHAKNTHDMTMSRADVEGMMQSA